MGLLKTYDPGQLGIIVGGKIISGFADGSMVKISRNEQAYMLKVGADGEGTRVRSRNKSGKIEITLMQSSDANDIFSAYAISDEATNSGAVPVLIRDGSGRTLVDAATAWVQKLPDSEFAKDAKERVWILETDEVNIFIGGN